MQVGDGSVRLTDTAGDVSFWEVAGGTAVLGDGSVIVNPFSISYDPDPFVTWGVSVKNNTAADVTFNFTFTVPYVSGPWGAVNSEFTANVTNEGVGAKLSNMSHESWVDGATVLTVAPADCVDPGIGGCGVFTGATLLGAPTALSGTLTSRMIFTIGARDSATLNGMTELTLAPAIPEPETYALMLLGLAAVSLVSRRRGLAAAAAAAA